MHQATTLRNQLTDISNQTSASQQTLRHTTLQSYYPLTIIDLILITAYLAITSSAMRLEPYGNGSILLRPDLPFTGGEDANTNFSTYTKENCKGDDGHGDQEIFCNIKVALRIVSYKFSRVIKDDERSALWRIRNRCFETTGQAQTYLNDKPDACDQSMYPVMEEKSKTEGLHNFTRSWDT